ncbi:hypothetical protein CDAR_268931 [Caerostris darwini]|uniref:Uncharacterized protein n=1 Tax=Caerostris darwini TaxID=1538125 RepID=A0AAV4X4B1_9ARAC|nr:hypothetical protein CDAR_268931 [Caerostris darwini]
MEYSNTATKYVRIKEYSMTLQVLESIISYGDLGGFDVKRNINIPSGKTINFTEHVTFHFVVIVPRYVLEILMNWTKISACMLRFEGRNKDEKPNTNGLKDHVSHYEDVKTKCL